MKLRPEELEFLSSWAREERAPDPYILPAHRLQAAHGVKGVSLIRLIKDWARSEGRGDEDIFDLPHNPNPAWTRSSLPGCSMEADEFGRLPILASSKRIGS
jgi:hypothetical protein